MITKQTLAGSLGRKIYPILLELAVEQIKLKESNLNDEDFQKYNEKADEVTEVIRTILRK
jgi:hypothetical protein